MTDRPKPGDVVNLRQARKARARATQQEAAQASRARHSATKAQKSLTSARQDKAARDLEGHHLETPRRGKGHDGEGSDN